MLLDQAARYPFLEPLRAHRRAPLQAGGEGLHLPPKNLGDFQDDLLTAKDDLLSPIKAFMHGPQRAAYDEAIAFLREEEANFAELPADRSPAAARSRRVGSSLSRQRRARGEDRRHKLRGLLADLLNAERDRGALSP